MVLQSSGAISLSDIQNEFGGANPISLSEYYDAASGIPSSGTISFSDFHGKSATVLQNTYDDLKEMRSVIVSKNYTYNTSVSTIKSLIEGKGYELVATPKYGNMAEGMTGESDITSLGKFSTSRFTSSAGIFGVNYLEKSKGFSNSLLNGRPFMIIAVFDNLEFKGFLCMIFRSMQSALLRDFFYPSKSSYTGHDIYAFILNADGSEIINTDNNTKWNFSNSQRPNSSGYHSTSKFSADDGAWGVRLNSRVDGNYPGPRFSGASYGLENYNWNDSRPYYYWGKYIGTNNSTYSNKYCAYVFVKRISYPS